MTVEIREQPVSRRGRASIGTATSIDYTWQVKGTDDLDVLMSTVKAARPAYIVDPVWGYTLLPGEISWDRIGYRLYDVTIGYLDESKIEEVKQLEIGESRFSFSTMGGSVRIYTSLETVGRYEENGGTAPLQGNAIGVTEDGIEGTDVIIPAMQFQLEFRHPRAFISDGYAALLELMTGTTNADTFRSRPPGEVLFLGATGSQGTVSDPTLTYYFARSPNLIDQVIGGITGIAKKGHEYVWVQYRNEFEEDGDRQIKVKRPSRVYVERLHQSLPFALLGVG